MTFTYILCKGEVSARDFIIMYYYSYIIFT